VTVDKACKIDLRDAYRQVALDPSQYKLTGLQWHFADDSDPTFLYDSRLPFGASKSVGCFHRITQSIVRMIHGRVKYSTLCYIQGFLLISDSYQQCVESMKILIYLLLDLGFTISWDKCESTSQKICFLGINLVSITGTMTILDAKLHDIRQFSSLWINKQKATKREIQSLVGKLSCIARCVKAIDPIFRSLIDLQKRLKHASHHTRIPQYNKADIRYFTRWCVQFNGVVFICAKVSQPQPDTTVYKTAP
jgi:hypothetical protein